MDNLLTATATNYAILCTRYSLGRLTQYMGMRHKTLQTINGWQPKSVSQSAFIAASHFLKITYIYTGVAVNSVEINNYGNTTRRSTLTGFTRRATAFCSV